MSTRSIPGWTPDEILAEAEDQMFGMENNGICINCGALRGMCEPDAREYPCDDCGQNKVYGAAELLMMGYGG